LAFLTGQFWVCQELNAAGFFAASNPANAFFYLLTGLHGLHLAGGLFVWAKTTTKVWTGFGADNVVEVGKVRLSVELCTVYWHYLLLVWLVLLGLLLST
jgi:cytochrome c oxidase subunit 3